MRGWLDHLVQVDYADPDVARRAQTLNAFIAASVPVALLAAVVLFPYTNGPISSAFLVGGSVALLGIIWLTHRGQLRAATWLFATVLALITVGQPLVTGDLSTNPMLIPLCTVMLVLLQAGTNDQDTAQLPRAVWLLNAALATLLTVLVAMYAAHQSALTVRREDALATQLTARDAVLHRLQELANSDPLTGFLNRRSLAESFMAAPPKSAVALLDLDHFKAINDDHSHAAGDSILVGFSGLVAAGAAANDLLFRLGGDEFLIVRPGSSAAELGMWLHELRDQVHAHRWPELPEDATVSFSAGVINRSGAALKDALRETDEALYAAKERGRDSIVVID